MAWRGPTDGTTVEFNWTRQDGSELHVRAEYQSNEDCWYVSRAFDCESDTPVTLTGWERRELDYVAGDEYRTMREAALADDAYERHREHCSDSCSLCNPGGA